jgi:ribosome-associated protein
MDDSQEEISKSQRKRDARALQALGLELVELNPDQLARLALPEDLHAAVELARTIRQRGGRKRQLQYIGKLLRHVDADPIREQLDILHQRSQAATARFHLLERWRDRLIQADDAAIDEILATFPHADRQQLRQLARNARKETQQQPPAQRSARALFRYLRQLQEHEA